MANTSRINGFKPVKHIDGSPYNGQCTLYAVNSSDGTALFVGDSVKLATGANSAGVNYVTAHAAGVAGTGQAAIGVVVGVVNAKLDPVTGSMTSASIALDTPQYRAASTAQYVLVADDPGLIFEVEATSGGSAYSFAVADVGKNCNVFAGSGSTTTGNSAFSADLNDKGTTATLPFRVIGVSKRADNDPTGNYTKILVKINNHQLSAGTGAAGV